MSQCVNEIYEKDCDFPAINTYETNNFFYCYV